MPFEKQVSLSEERFILNFYLNGYSSYDIANFLGWSRTTITRILHINNIKIRKQFKHIDKLTDKQKNLDIINLYECGNTIKYISGIFNVPIKTISRILKNKNIPIRHNKYNIDSQYFNKIDTKIKAYWLGFIYADGCISKLETNPTFNLSQKYRGILDTFCLHTKSTYPVMVRKKGCSVEIYNREFIFNLYNKGVVERKSNVIKFPKLPKNLIRHFIRGYFDGDGCFHVGTNRRFSCLFNIVSGSFEFLNDIKIILESNCDLNNVKIRSAIGKSYSLNYGGRLQAKRIFEYLYTDGVVFLERKYNKFREIVDTIV